MNDLRVVRWTCTDGTNGTARFMRTDSKGSYHIAKNGLHHTSKNRLLHTVRRYVHAGYELVPNLSGWTLVVKR